MPKIERNRRVDINGLTLKADVLVLDANAASLSAGTYYHLVDSDLWLKAKRKTGFLMLAGRRSARLDDLLKN